MPISPRKHRPKTASTRTHQVEERKNSTQRGYGYKWQKARERFLRLHPLCRQCEDEDRLTVATVVDHIIPHKGNMRLFWDRDNWQPLCKPHHDAKTAKEDGGFGRPQT